MSAEKVKCRDCRCCDEKESKCRLTGRPVTLDSERHCKRFGRTEK